MHPMEAKMALGKIVVADFHSADDAERAAEVFNAVVRRKEVPADIPTVPMPDGVRVDGGIRVDKLLAQRWAGRIGERRGAQDQGGRGGNQRREGEGSAAGEPARGDG